MKLILNLSTYPMEHPEHVITPYGEDDASLRHMLHMENMPTANGIRLRAESIDEIARQQMILEPNLKYAIVSGPEFLLRLLRPMLQKRGLEPFSDEQVKSLVDHHYYHCQKAASSI